ncbi:MAG: hypothetical protein ACREBE_29040, partial [bacterium]
MAQKFKPGDIVRQKMPAPVEGTLVGFDLDRTTGDVQFCVAERVKDAAGEYHAVTRFFTEEQLELVKTREDAEKEWGAA